MQPALGAARVRLGRHVPSAPVAAQELFDKRHTDPKQVCEGALGAKPPCVGVDNLVA
jgi:hypothetical protein